MNEFRSERYHLCINIFNRVGIQVDCFSMTALSLEEMYNHISDYGNACMDRKILLREEYKDFPIESVYAKYNFENLESSYNPFHASLDMLHSHLHDCEDALSHGYMLLRELIKEVLVEGVIDIDDYDMFERLESCYHPVQAAAELNTVKVMELLMTEFPDSASGLYIGCNNLLHFAVNDTKNDIAIVEAKVRFLSTKFPNMLRDVNRWGLSKGQIFKHKISKYAKRC
jgi:hypothetical protein